MSRSTVRSATRGSVNAQYDAALRDAIVVEATRRLQDAAPESLGLRSLAASQSTSTTAIYTLFGGKAGLLTAVAQQADEQFAEALRTVLGHDRVEADMRALCRAYRRWALDNRGIYRLVVHEADSTPRADVGRSSPQWRRVLLEVVDALVDEGVFRTADVHEITASIWASLHGVVSLEISAWWDSPSAEQYFETQLRAILRSWSTAGEDGAASRTVM